MIDILVLKKTESKFTFKPSDRITHEEFVKWIESNSKFTWCEDTNHGKRQYQRRPDLPKKVIAYVNYDPENEKSFVQCSHANGKISISFDSRLVYHSLVDLVNISNDEWSCRLWLMKNKKIVDMEYIHSKYKKRK